ncbi:unnamed protein product [Phytomonas sp. Hart1]|nr:unnamed protein product [Phytomonas sp. Hart1]|eukprot:CCW70887.1 unnamed protein product [Phytomonas sp. isolate Hart1]
MHTKNSIHQHSVAGSSKPLTVDKDKYELVHALVSSAGMPHHNRLSSIYELLCSVVHSARTVVKGTDSQRRFSACFSELCRGALMGLADLEDSVFELRNPGRTASDAIDDEIMGINEVVLIKELSAYVASHTPGLTAQYLEHVGLSVLSKFGNARSRKGSASASCGMSDSNVNRKKRTRSTGEVTLDANRKRSTQTNQGIAPYNVSVGALDPFSAHHAIHTAFDDLGPMENDEAMMRSATTAAASNPSAPSGSTFHPKTTGATLGLSHSSTVASCKPLCASSKDIFILSSDGTKAFDLSASQPNLRAIPELCYYFLPWTMPAPKSVLDRVTLEKERHTSSGGSFPASGVAADNSHEDPPHHQGLIPIFEVCFAATPAELLSQWEGRDAALSSMAFGMPWGGGDDHQECCRRKKLVPLLTVDSKSSNDHTSRFEMSDEIEKEGDVVRRSGKEEHTKGEGFTEKPFFPFSACTCNAVPVTVLKDLVFNGVSSIDFIHYP